MFRQGINWPLIWHEMSRRAERGHLSWRREGETWLRLLPVIVAPVIIIFPNSLGTPLDQFVCYAIYGFSLLWGLTVNIADAPQSAREYPVPTFADDETLIASGGASGQLLLQLLPSLAAVAYRLLRPIALLYVLVVAGFLTIRDWFGIAVFLSSVMFSSTALILVSRLWGRRSTTFETASPLLVIGIILLAVSGVSLRTGIGGDLFVVLRVVLDSLSSIFLPGGMTRYVAVFILVAFSLLSLASMSFWRSAKRPRRPIVVRRRRVRRFGKMGGDRHGALACAALEGSSFMDRFWARWLVGLILIPVSLVPVVGVVLLVAMAVALPMRAVGIARRDGKLEDVVLSFGDDRAIFRSLTRATLMKNAVLLPAFFATPLFGDLALGLVPNFNALELWKQASATWTPEGANVSLGLMLSSLTVGTLSFFWCISILGLEVGLHPNKAYSSFGRSQTWGLMILGGLLIWLWLMFVTGSFAYTVGTPDAVRWAIGGFVALSVIVTPIAWLLAWTSLGSIHSLPGQVLCREADPASMPGFE